MRLPVLPNISTKDGTSNKNARLTNVLKVSGPKDIAEIRPGLISSSTYAGLGAGLIEFDGRLLAIYDDTIFIDDGDYSEEWPLDSDEWNAGTEYSYGDSVWYLGSLWFASQIGTGETPTYGSAYWSGAYIFGDYDPEATYDIGDDVTFGGVIYYSMASSNVGNDPSSSPVWSTTAPGTSRYRGTITVLSLTAAGAGAPGAQCASVEAAAFSAFSTATSFISCATKASGTFNWITYVGVVFRPGFGYFIRGNQWTDPLPHDCSGTPLDSGVIDIGTVTQTA